MGLSPASAKESKFSKAFLSDAPLIVAEAVWQYSHHVLAGLTTHQGPILTVANWSGQWPGLVGMLNLNGSLTKADIQYSTLWSADFADDYFTTRVENWLEQGKCTHEISHVRDFSLSLALPDAQILGDAWPTNFVTKKQSWECSTKAAWGCLTRSSLIIFSTAPVFSRNDSVNPRGTTNSTQVDPSEADQVRAWMESNGMKFHTGPNHETDQPTRRFNSNARCISQRRESQMILDVTRSEFSTSRGSATDAGQRSR